MRRSKLNSDREIREYNHVQFLNSSEGFEEMKINKIKALNVILSNFIDLIKSDFKNIKRIRIKVLIYEFLSKINIFTYQF